MWKAPSRVIISINTTIWASIYAKSNNSNVIEFLAFGLNAAGSIVSFPFAIVETAFWGIAKIFSLLFLNNRKDIHDELFLSVATLTVPFVYIKAVFKHTNGDHEWTRIMNIMNKSVLEYRNTIPEINDLMKDYPSTDPVPVEEVCV